jgi:hypothetical protein
MDLTYMVLGADGKEYGPVTLNQLTGWINEGRVPPQQQVRRSDMQHWAAASAFAELKSLFEPVNLPPASSATNPASPRPLSQAGGSVADGASFARMKVSASWFYWVAGLSLVNSIVAFTGGNFRFIFGLGVTQLIDEFASQMSGSSQMIALALNIAAAGIFILFGVFAHKGHTWAFIIGMVLFALDGVILVLARQWLGVAFHAYVLFRLFQGFTACRELRD